jgi:peptide chain release factor 1
MDRSLTHELIVEIQHGEGGADSKIFVHELLAVYLKYGQSKGFSSELLSSEDGHAIVRFSGKGVWAAFKSETGKHCVQRIGSTEANDRRHTSFVSVAVLPIPEEQVLKSLPESELKITFMRGHGAGGQHRNVTDSACRIVHIRTGLTVFIQTQRDQHANRRYALRILTARVNELDQQKQHEDYNAQRKILGQGGRGETDKIRTYNFLKSFAVDHRTGKKTGNIKGLMKGNLNLLM